jgi:hypothetical protein
MKRLILPIFCIAILAGCTMQKKPETTTELSHFTPYGYTPEFLKGQVKSVEQRSYWTTEQDGKYLQGDLITRKERDSIGWTDDFIAYFDSMGIANRIEYLDDEGKPYGYWVIQCSDGKRTGAQWFQGDSSSSYWKYTYDDSGNLTRGERFRLGADTLLNGGNIKSIKDWQVTSVQWYNNKREPGNTIARELNDMGLVTQLETRNPEGKVISWWKYNYDENGLNTGFTGMSSDSTMYNVETKYTDFDDMGNWLKMVSFEDGKLAGMDVRTIVYY